MNKVPITDRTSIIKAIYDERKWQDGIAGEANIVKYYDSNVIGISKIENNRTKKDIISSHNNDLLRALSDLAGRL